MRGVEPGQLLVLRPSPPPVYVQVEMHTLHTLRSSILKPGDPKLPLQPQLFVIHQVVY